MRSRPLGRTGIQVSELGFGCWAIGGNAYGPVRDEDSLEALETAWSEGVNFFDTADVYGEGHSEELLRKFIKGKPRGKIILASKAGWDFYGGAHKKNFSPDYLRLACDRSLQRLGVNEIDLYQLHNPSLELIRSGEPVSILESLKKQGKIRHIGISIHVESEALAALEDPRVECLQVIFNILDQRMVEKVFSEASRKEIGIIVREPLAHGILTGKYPPDHEFPKDDHRRRWSVEKREWDWEKVQMVRKRLEYPDGMLPQVALEFALSFQEVSAVIPGAKTKAQVLQNLEAVRSPRLPKDKILTLGSLYSEDPLFQKGLLPQ